MLRFKITILACIIMAVLVPLTDIGAVSKDSPFYTHFIYIAFHNGYLHYIINAWSLLVMHNLFRWYRVLTAYTFAVFISYVAAPPQPMVGASLFTCFFFGLIALYLWHKSRLALILTAALMLLTCFLPGYAGIQHVMAFSFGFLFSLIEGYIRRFRHYLNP